LDAKKEKIDNFKQEQNKPDFWDNPKKSSKILKELSALENLLKEFHLLNQEVNNIDELFEICENENEETHIISDFDILIKKINQFEIKVLLSGEYDNNNCYFSLHSGTGGVDAMDFTDMLLRMYMRFFDDKNFKINMIDKQKGEEAGIKSVLLEVSGDYAYGLLKAEKGVHRLVRKSPFNSKGLRQTSFALAEVIPQIDQDDDININPDDIKIDTFRSQGAGGQSVNTTDSAVRITHLKSGIVVQCQNERSQLQNKEQAMKILSSKLKMKTLEDNDKKLREVSGETSEASWGNQIRSYVLQPYTLVKDHRTNYEETDVNKVLDGHLEIFIEKFLRMSKK